MIMREANSLGVNGELECFLQNHKNRAEVVLTFSNRCFFFGFFLVFFGFFFGGGGNQAQNAAREMIHFARRRDHAVQLPEPLSEALIS